MLKHNQTFLTRLQIVLHNRSVSQEVLVVSNDTSDVQVWLELAAT